MYYLRAWKRWDGAINSLYVLTIMTSMCLLMLGWIDENLVIERTCNHTDGAIIMYIANSGIIVTDTFITSTLALNIKIFEALWMPS